VLLCSEKYKWSRGFFQIRLSQLSSGDPPGSTVVVEGVAFKLHPSAVTADTGIYS
jgi:hypothetical protein